MIGTMPSARPLRLRNFFCEVETVDRQHGGIGDNEIGFVAPEGFPRLVAIYREIDFGNAERLKERHQQMTHIGAVIDDENFQFPENGIRHALSPNFRPLTRAFAAAPLCVRQP